MPKLSQGDETKTFRGLKTTLRSRPAAEKGKLIRACLGACPPQRSSISCQNQISNAAADAQNFLLRWVSPKERNHRQARCPHAARLTHSRWQARRARYLSKIITGTSCPSNVHAAAVLSSGNELCFASLSARTHTHTRHSGWRRVGGTSK